MKIKKDNRVGITEAGEVAFNLDVFERLYKANIIITKRLTDKLIDKLIEHKDKIILHLTCTGWGGTEIEPMVPTVEQTYDKFCKLIDGGFPVEQVVLRVDPIIPTTVGIEKVQSVFDLFKDSDIKRLRYSVLDMYNHVKDRFNDLSIKLPYDSFHAPMDVRIKVFNFVDGFCRERNIDLEVCGEPGFNSLSCVSQKDIDILGLTDEIELIGSAEQRKSCGCPANKSELLRKKPQRCSNKCLYCFWKSDD